MLTLGNRIKYYRKKSGLSQEKVARHLGMQQANYAKYESGLRNPKDDKLIAMTHLFDVSYNELLTGEERIMLDMMNSYVRVAVLGQTETFECYVSDIQGNINDHIQSCFEGWAIRFAQDEEAFYHKFLNSPILFENLVKLHDYYNESVHDFYIEHNSENFANPCPEYQFNLLREQYHIDYNAIYKLAFCIAASRYLQTDPDNIYKEIRLYTDLVKTDKDCLTYFAVKVFVPYLDFILDTLEMLNDNSLVDDFDLYFVYEALSVSNQHIENNGKETVEEH